MINKKIVSDHISSSEQKPTNINLNGCDYTDRKYKAEINQNYSDRKVGSSQKKNTIIDKYDKFIEQELNKKPVGIPRT